MFFHRKKKKIELTKEEIKGNLLWDKYANGTLDKDYDILCDYHPEDEGHHCFLDNKEDDLSQYVTSLKVLLPEEFYNQFYKAYKAYIDDQNVSEICSSADDYFCKNEQVIIDILQEYANSLSDTSNSD